MKRLALLLITICSLSSIYAQESIKKQARRSKIKLGRTVDFRVSLPRTTLNNDTKKIILRETGIGPAFNILLVSELHPVITLRTGIGVAFNDPVNVSGASMYFQAIEIPNQIMVHLLKGKRLSPYLVAGINMVQYFTPHTNDMVQSLSTNHDLIHEFGFGCEINCTFLRLFPEIKLSHGTVYRKVAGNTEGAPLDYLTFGVSIY